MQEVCAILLTLHLLESRPLPETLATLLAQRTRSLTTALSRPRDRNLNGSAPEASTSAHDSTGTKSRKVVIRAVRQKLKAVLDILVKTMETSRTNFLRRAQQDGLPLMADVLRYVQGEEDTAEKSLPSEVRLSSQSLLSSLPSSNHFLLLPASVKLYRPYVDDSSLKTTDGKTFGHRLEEWFQKALQSLKTAMESWFSELHSIRDLWQICGWCKTWIRSTKSLDAREVNEFNKIMDAVCKQQATKIWRSVLTSTHRTFQDRLESTLHTLSKDLECPGMSSLMLMKPSYHSYRHVCRRAASSISIRCRSTIVEWSHDIKHIIHRSFV